jgi:hypothetical protein
MGEFKLKIIDAESDEVYTVLGISEERSDEIAEIVTEAYKNEKYFTQSLDKIVSQMNHVNELVFAILCAARVHDAKKHRDIQEQLKAMKAIVELMKFKMK